MHLIGLYTHWEFLCNSVDIADIRVRCPLDIADIRVRCPALTLGLICSSHLIHHSQRQNKEQLRRFNFSSEVVGGTWSSKLPGRDTCIQNCSRGTWKEGPPGRLRRIICKSKTLHKYWRRVEWIRLAHNRLQWRTIVNTVPYKRGSLLQWS